MYTYYRLNDECWKVAGEKGQEYQSQHFYKPKQKLFLT